MPSQEGIKGLEFLGHSFDVIHAVDANDDLQPFEPLLKYSDYVFDIRLVQAFAEFFRVYANWEGTCLNLMVICDYTVLGDFAIPSVYVSLRLPSNRPGASRTIL